MTINGLSSAAAISYAPSASRPPAQPAGDQVSMSISPELFSSLVSDASQMPDVRGEVVDAYKSRVQSGEYPTQDALNGLVDLMGGTWIAQARTDDSSAP
jgi:hypothetical protein